MVASLLFKGIIAGWITSVPLGPVGILCIQRTVKEGHKMGFIASLGATIADTIFAITACLGLSFINAFINEWKNIFQMISGMLILIIGMGIYLKSKKFVRPNEICTTLKTSYQIDFLSGFLVTLSNPLTVFFFLAYFSGINFPVTNSGYCEVIVLVTGIVMGSASWFYALSGLTSYFRSKIHSGVIVKINKWCGLILIFTGLVISVKLLVFQQ